MFQNQREELIQRCAWRLVRAAEDKLGAGKGPEKREWAADRLQEEFPKLKGAAESYIRAAYFHFKIETTGILERRTTV